MLIAVKYITGVRMIALFTDFGWNGPYVGQLKAVLVKHAPTERIIDLMHDAPCFNVKASAYLLASLINSFPDNTIFLAVVDPGVGGERVPCIVKADNYWFIGPDNGLFNIICERADICQKWEISWQPDVLSNTFHGRDLFAPLVENILGDELKSNEKTNQVSLKKSNWPVNLNEVIYIDHYGNCMTGINCENIDYKKKIQLDNNLLEYKKTFSEVEQGAAFWTINSNGLVEIAINQGRADKHLNLKVADVIYFNNG